MISLAGQTMRTAVAGDGGNRTCRGWTRWRIGACAALFAASALFGQQVQFRGSVPTGAASPTPLSLTLDDAIVRGLRNNLGLLLSGQASEIARAERLRSPSALLPQVTGALSESVQQIDLKTRGINFHLPGGFSTPTVVGPFHYADARAYASQSAFSITASTRQLAAPRRKASAPLNCRSETRATSSCSPWRMPTCW